MVTVIKLIKIIIILKFLFEIIINLKYLIIFIKLTTEIINIILSR